MAWIPVLEVNKSSDFISVSCPQQEYVVRTNKDASAAPKQNTPNVPLCWGVSLE